MTGGANAIPYYGAGNVSVFAAAARWIESALLGSVATGVAVLAIAVIGLLMLSGRVDIRRGAVVVIGCFILFGAPRIAQGLRGGINTLADTEPTASVVVVAPPAVTPTPMPVPQAFDPYASAAVPQRP